MKRRNTARTKRILAIFSLLLVVAIGSGFAEPYDSDAVKQVMRNNLTQLRAIGAGMEEGDYYAIAAPFFSLAEGMMSILPMEPPPRGDTEEFHETIKEVIKVSFLGIGACGVQYDAGIQDAFARLREMSGIGHAAHQPPRG